MNSARDDIRLRMPGYPIRKSPDQSLLGGSPKLIAASHVLHRSLAPRHPPCALSSLTTLSSNSYPRHHKALLRIPYYSVVKDHCRGRQRLRVQAAAKSLRHASRTTLCAHLWWSGPGSNRQPPACKADALPVELPPRSRLMRAARIIPPSAGHGGPR